MHDRAGFKWKLSDSKTCTLVATVFYGHDVKGYQLPDMIVKVLPAVEEVRSPRW